MVFEIFIWNYLEYKICKKESECNRLRIEDIKNLLIEIDGYVIVFKKWKLDDVIIVIIVKYMVKF